MPLVYDGNCKTHVAVQFSKEEMFILYVNFMQIILRKDICKRSKDDVFHLLSKEY